MASPITYYLPKKILKIAFPLIIIERRTNYTNGDVVVEPLAAFIRGDVKISSILLPDLSRMAFEYEPKPITWLNKTTLGIEYDPDGAGLLLSLNSQETNLIGDIISATIDLASSLVKIAPVAVARDVVPAGPTVESVINTERQLDVVNFIEPKLDEKIMVPLPVLAVELPTVNIYFSKYPGGTVPDWTKTSQTKEENRLIFYLLPISVLVKVEVENNSYIEKQTVAEELVYLPQFGHLQSKEVIQKSWWFGASMNTTFNFSASTGSLQKFTVTTDSNVKDLLADAKKAADARKAATPIRSSNSLSDSPSRPSPPGNSPLSR
jgi:hypothetical protein